jgi:hypothetical protein
MASNSGKIRTSQIQGRIITATLICSSVFINLMVGFRGDSVLGKRRGLIHKVKECFSETSEIFSTAIQRKNSEENTEN